MSGVTIQNSGVAGIYVQDGLPASPGTPVSLTISGGTAVTGGPTGILVGGTHASAVITGNTGSIYGNSIGIDVNGGSATISGNHIYGNTTGIKFENGGTGSVSGNDFTGSTANGTDLLIASSAGSVTIGDGNAFAGTTDYIQDLRNQSFDLSAYGATTFSGFNAAMTAVTAGNLAGFYGVEDMLVDGLDNASDGYVRIKSGYDFVAASSETAAAGAIQRAVNLAAAGDTIDVQAGTYAGSVTVNKPLSLRGRRPTRQPPAARPPSPPARPAPRWNRSSPPRASIPAPAAW